MKTKIFFLISLLFILFSCTEDGPFKMGKIECEIQESMVTPTTALVTVKLPENNDLIKKIGYVYLSETPINNLNDFEEKKENFIISDHRNLGKGEYFFKDLTPNTKYYVIVGLGVDYNDNNANESWYYETEPYCPGYSITTAKEGDYSMLGEISCKLIESNLACTLIKIILPSNIEMDRYTNYVLEASTSPNMENTIQSELRQGGDNFDTFLFKNLVKGKYYFRLIGDFITKEPYQEYNNITLNACNSLDVSYDENFNADSEIYFGCENYTIFKINFPKHIFASYDYDDWGKYKIVISTQEGSIPIEGNYGIDNSYCMVYVPRKYKEYEEINFTISGPFVYDNINQLLTDLEITSKVIFRSENSIVPNPYCETIFSGTDYSIAKVNYPDGIHPSNSIDLKYYFSANKNISNSYTDVCSAIDNNVILKTISDKGSEYYLQVKGNFSINTGNSSYRYFENLIINIDGGIKPSINGDRLFNISTQKEDNGLSLIITCPSEFHFEYFYDTKIKCRSAYDDSNSILFEQSQNFQLSTNSKIVFSLSHDTIEKLLTGEKYIISITGFNLMKGSLYLNSSNDSFDLEWVY